MKQKNLYVMCGIPGAGKSTWVKRNASKDAAVISRDEIRFSMLGENDEYFANEKRVFKTYIDCIQTAIDNLNGPNDIYCDATHISKASRDKLFNALDLGNVKNITVIVLRPNLEITMKRNEMRTGRAHVPSSVVRRMWYQFERPEDDEPRIFDTKYVEV